MGKPFDVSKFRKNITKAIDGISVGFTDPTDWISTNNLRSQLSYQRGL